MKKLMLLLAAVMMFISANIAYALPQFWMSGYAQDNTGAVVYSTTLPVVVTIYEGDTQVFTETHPAVTINEFGMFQVKVGSVGAGLGALTIKSNTNIRMAVNGVISNPGTKLTQEIVNYAIMPGAITLTNGKMLIGDALNQAAEVNMSGDATISNAGVLTIANGAVTTAKIADANVTGVKLENYGPGAATYGNATNFPIVTVDAKGRVSNITTSPIPAEVDPIYTAAIPTIVYKTTNPTVVDIAGSYNGGFTIQNNAVTTAKILDGSVTQAKLSATGAAAGYVLKTNGTTMSWGDATVYVDYPLSGTGTSASHLIVNHDATLVGASPATALGINLGNANSWSALQTFSAGLNGTTGTFSGLVTGANFTTAGTYTGNLVNNVATGNGLTGGTFNNSASKTFAVDQAYNFAWTGNQTFAGTSTYNNDMVLSAGKTLYLGSVGSANGTIDGNGMIILGSAGTPSVLINMGGVGDFTYLTSGLEINNSNNGKIINPSITNLLPADNAGTLTPKGYVDALIAALSAYPFVTVGNVAGLTAERAIATNSTLTTLDGGANGSYTIGINLTNPNTWTGAQTFNGGILGTNITLTGNASFGGTLAVTGTSTFTGSAAFNGGLTGTTGAFTGLLSTTNNATVGGTFAVTGTSTHTGSAAFNGGLTGTTGAFTGLLSTTSNATVGGTLGVTGTATAGQFNGPLQYSLTAGNGLSGTAFNNSAASTFTVNQGYAFAWTGAQTWSNTTTFNGASTFTAGVFSNAIVNSGDFISGSGVASTFTVNATSTFQQPASFTTVTTSGDVLVGGSGSVFNNPSPSADLHVVGNLEIDGTSYFATIAAGVWNGTSIADAYVDNNLTIVAGTVNNTPIGAVTPNTGAFTTLSTTGLATLNSVAVTNNATVGGTFAVTSTSAFTGSAAFNGGLTGTTGAFTGLLSTTSNATVGGTLGVTGNTTVGGTLGVTGTATAGQYNGPLQFSLTAGNGLNGTAFNNGAASTFSVNQGYAFAWTGAQTWANTATFSGATQINNTLGVTGNASFGTIIAGTWNGTAIADAYVDDNLTISGGTVNNTPIGAGVPSTGAFTTLASSGAATLNSASITTTLGVTGVATLGGNAYPIVPGTNGQFLKTNGAGTLSWADVVITLQNAYDGGRTITTASAITPVQITAFGSTANTALALVGVGTSSASVAEITAAGNNALVTKNWIENGGISNFNVTTTFNPTTASNSAITASNNSVGNPTVVLTNSGANATALSIPDGNIDISGGQLKVNYQEDVTAAASIEVIQAGSTGKGITVFMSNGAGTGNAIDVTATGSGAGLKIDQGKVVFAPNVYAAAGALDLKYTVHKLNATGAYTAAAGTNGQFIYVINASGGAVTVDGASVANGTAATFVYYGSWYKVQ